MKGSFSVVFAAATMVILLGHLFFGAYWHARCAFDLPGKRSIRAPLSFLGLSGYRYFVFSSLRPALLKYIHRHSCSKHTDVPKTDLELPLLFVFPGPRSSSAARNKPTLQH